MLSSGLYKLVMNDNNINDVADGLRRQRDAYRLALLNIAATGRKWAIANGGDTPLAIIAGMARNTLGLSFEQVDEEVARLNRNTV